MNLRGVDPRWLLYGAAIVGIVYVGWKLTRVAGAAAQTASEVAATVADAVNPASETNIVNRGVSAVGAAVTGDDSWSLGGQLAEWFDPATRAANESLRKKAPEPSGGYSYVDPWGF